MHVAQGDVTYARALSDPHRVEHDLMMQKAEVVGEVCVQTNMNMLFILADS